MTEKTPEMEVLLERGRESKELLGNPVFLRTVNRLAEQFTSSLFTTQPHDTAGRESLYHQAVSLQAIVDLLAQDVQVAEEIRLNQQQDD